MNQELQVKIEIAREKAARTKTSDLILIKDTINDELELRGY